MGEAKESKKTSFNYVILELAILIIGSIPYFIHIIPDSAAFISLNAFPYKYNTTNLEEVFQTRDKAKKTHCEKIIKSIPT